jgi:AcrR family transcriptional regulator
MNTSKPKRSYDMSKRANSAAQTELDIFNATAELWHEQPIGDITLEAIAARANVSVRTIIRKYGSKEGLFETCIQNNADVADLKREHAKIGEIEQAVSCLLQDYEEHGKAVIRTLALEEQLDIARKVSHKGRLYHKAWCERIFAPYLPNSSSIHFEPQLLAFVAATDIYLWKLLRHDLDKDIETTKATLIKMVNGIITN